MHNFYCPFCGKKLEECNKRLLLCNECRLAVDLQQRKAWVVSGAPSYVSESFKLLNLLCKLEPQFVMSRFKLFSKEFTVQACKFFGCSRPSDEVTCADFNSFVQSKDLHLIAGNHFIANNLVKLFRSSITSNYETSPFHRSAYLESNTELFIAVMLASTNIKDSESQKLADAYFSPSLEHTIQVLWNKFNVDRISSVSDEQALYAVVFCGCTVNIEWDNTVSSMRDKLERYVKACLRDVSNVTCLIKPKYNLSKISFISSKWAKDFSNLYYKSMPSTALNQDTANDVCFDILNHEFACDYFSGFPEECVNSKVFMVLTNTYRVLSTLWEMFAGRHAIYGTGMKSNWLKSRGLRVPKNANEMVLEFWKEMEKELQHEKG